MPYLCKKEKGNDKNFHLKKKKFLYHKFFFEIFWKIFFALNPFLGWFKAKKIFPKKFQKKFWPKKNRIFFQIKIFDISFFFFAKVRQEYQNILSWLFKNHHRRSICLAVLLQEHFQKAHFNIGHPVMSFCRYCLTLLSTQ